METIAEMQAATMLQSIKRRRVYNHSEFGRKMQRVARLALPAFLADSGFGFQDGGCQIFAEALVIWSDGALRPMAVYAGGRVQHVFAGNDAIAVDSDGIAFHSEMVRKCEALEGISGAYVADYAFGDSPQIPHDTAQSEALTKRLRAAIKAA